MFGGRSLVNEVNHVNMVVSWYVVHVTSFLLHDVYFLCIFGHSLRCWEISYFATKKFIHVVCSSYVQFSLLRIESIHRLN